MFDKLQPHPSLSPLSNESSCFNLFLGDHPFSGKRCKVFEEEVEKRMRENQD